MKKFIVIVAALLAGSVLTVGCSEKAKDVKDKPATGAPVSADPSDGSGTATKDDATKKEDASGTRKNGG